MTILDAARQELSAGIHSQALRAGASLDQRPFNRQRHLTALQAL